MNKKLDELKNEYMQIQPSKEFKQKIENTVENNKGVIKMKNYSYKKRLAIAACLTIFATGSIGALNISPTFASTISNIPGMETIVKVLTFNRYEISENGMEATVVTPKIQGLLNQELQDKLNETFKNEADSVILEFEEEMKEMAKDFPDGDAHIGIESNYIIKTDNEDILALDLYLLQTVGSSSTVHKFYTIDKKTSTLLTLPSLFLDGADYITPINEYLKKEMIRQNSTGENVYWIDSEHPGNDFKTIQEDQNFYINDKGNLVICFNKYDVGPGSSGSPEFEISNDIIKNIIK